MKATRQLVLLALLFVNWAAGNTPTTSDSSDATATIDPTDLSITASNPSSPDSTDSTDSPDSTDSTAGTLPPTATTAPTSPTDSASGPPSTAPTAPTASPTQTPAPGTSGISISTQDPSAETGPSNTTSETPSNTSPQVTSRSTVSSSQTSGTTGPRNSCQSNPCGDNASCLSLFSSYVCLCVEGFYYNNRSLECERGKVFPGEIGVLVSETSSLDNTNSKAYEDLHREVTEFFEAALSPDYKQTVILKVSTSPSLSARSGLRAGDQTVYVWVVNILEQTTNLNEMEVAAQINEAAANKTNIKQYSSQDRCDFYGCEKSGQGDCSNILECTCKSGMQRPTPLSPCVAVGCSEKCDAKHNKQCSHNKDSGKFECMCLSGYKKDGNGNCQKCSFGYSGVECTDQFELILTIVGTIAGILVLGLVIALIVSARSKNKKKNIEEQHLIDNDFQSLRLQQTGFSNLGAEGSIFPKVKAVASKDSGVQNPYERERHRNVPHPDY